VKRVWLALAAALFFVGVPDLSLGQDFDTKAKSAILMDFETGAQLYEKNADEPFAPGSFVKLVTIAGVFEALKSGRVALEDRFVISEHGWRDGGPQSGGPTMFAVLGSEVAVADLVRGIVIASGNDAAIALAEGIGGNEDAFVGEMRALGRTIGLVGSTFMNSTGFPVDGQQMTARDVALVARYLIATFPEFYPIFAESDFTWNNTMQKNPGLLAEAGSSVDGLRTAFARGFGYSAVISTTERGRRLIAVINGSPSPEDRLLEARRLIAWGTPCPAGTTRQRPQAADALPECL
jgi:D-alanyl-D-alanine carboxypeptidase (penicillin-binding protein 5/6)